MTGSGDEQRVVREAKAAVAREDDRESEIAEALLAEIDETS